MTVTTATNKAGPYVGDDSNTTFSFTGIKTFAATDITVVRLNSIGTEDTLVYATDFTVSLNADQEASPGGSITYPVSGDPLSTDEYLTIRRVVPLLQSSDIANLGGFYPDVIENMADRSTMMAQQVAEDISTNAAGVAANLAAIESNDADILANANGVATNTGLINALVLNPSLSPQTLHDVRRYGMSVSNTGAENHAALVIAVATGLPLDFMEVYPMLKVSTIVVPDGSDLHWYSSNGKGGLDFELRAVPDGNYVLREGLISVHIMGKILVDGLYFASPDNDVNSIITGPDFLTLPEGGTQYVEDLIFRNCYFTGRIEACYFRGEVTTDPTAAWFGVRRALFENNETKDVYARLFNLRHIPHDEIVMKNNRFHNHDVSILYSGISNGSANGDEVYEEKRLIVCKDNEWTTDDDFWATNTSETYLTFVVYEGREIVTTGNVMSGVKTVITGLVIYLTYSSALHVTESNNIYINNAHLDRANARNTLMKSKSIPEPVGSNRVGTRTYQHNQYIIEEEWLTTIGKVAADCCHTLTELPTALFPTVDNITDNVMRLMSVEGMGANDGSHQSYSARFDRNQIYAQNWNTYIIANPNHAMFSFNQGVSTDPTVFSLCDNIVSIENTLDVIGASFFEGGFNNGLFIMKNNHLKVPTTASFPCLWIGKTGSHRPSVIMENNICDADDQGSGTTGLFGIRNNMTKAIINEMSLQTVVGGASHVLNIPCMGVGSNAKIQLYGDYELKVYGPSLFQDADLNSLWPLYVGDHTVTVKIYREDSTGWQEVSFTYTFQYSAGDSDYRVQFNDSGGTARDYIWSGSVGVNTAIELLTNKGTSSALITSVALKNDGGNNRHWRVIPDNPFTNGITRIEIMVI